MIEIAGRGIGPNEPTFIIAEAGVNHNGSLDIAKQLVDAAVEAEVDAVKFQTFRAENLVSKQAPKAQYQLQTTDKEESQFDMIKKLELSLDDHLKLKEYCEDRDILLLSTPFCFKSVDIIDDLGLELYKVGSSDTTNLPLLKYIAKKGKPIILSTGMCTLAEVEEAVNMILATGNDRLILLHCVSNYPAKYQNVNLKAINTMRQAFKLPVGYSDHTLGIEIPVAAVAMGAVVIEKHFTLDNNMEGPDHKASLEPDELKQMVQSIRNIEKALGDGIKKPAESEIANIKVARKSLVVNTELKSGEDLNKEVLDIKRPGTGINPKFLNTVLGMEVKKDLKADQVLQWEDLKNG
ncbi:MULTISPECIES: N-acetylneuraminate synthase [unclassified Candidatus Frackibacter]|uniref:N-acetylneuraminate synthase n=1 Tax=unclassified Candidatus Frackibacter TaxID=2648818 RepID=UPI00079BA231|nr:MULTISPECIES: N-acetylneuraminate synthase [unclassified Candidatus Frackibacter]KXS40471.1 MAG: N-acetylneuraminate synthase [Candidatus Frackibacter sp. T328-2]SDC72769.1 N-acetylneuraminate synthase [Candidatus Frackibacter sp. WG11]SEM87028.1 N-acetylneuraminate synthase [Candidatus Frackibacter sp. WG12]SFL96080.1 N-acetylneuraminate synthase [Candidatus Frackibacter sp. WG13]